MSATNDLESLIDAIVETWHGSREKMTRPEITRAYGIGRQLLEQVGATPDELRRAARNYRTRHPDWPFTLQAVFGRWSECLTETPGNHPAPWEPVRASVCPSDEDRARVRALLTETKERHLRAV